MKKETLTIRFLYRTMAGRAILKILTKINDYHILFIENGRVYFVLFIF